MRYFYRPPVKTPVSKPKKSIWPFGSATSGDDYPGLEPNAWGDEEIFKREPIETAYRHVDRKKSYYNTVPLYLVEEATGSDYSGSTYSASNYRIIAAMDFPQIVRLYGGYGTYAIAFRLDMGPLPEELIDIAKSLARYPVLDEDDMSQLELDLETEAWDNYGRSDWKRALSVEFDSEVVDELDNDQLDKLWYDLDLSWRVEFETGRSAYFNIKEGVREMLKQNPNLEV